MANTYSQLHFHVVFSVKNKACSFSISELDSVFEVLRVVLLQEDVFPIVVGGYTDHIHALINIKPKYSISNIMSNIKSKSNKFLKEKKHVKDNFEWQVGYSVFSISHNDVFSVRRYILDQKSHHQKLTFEEEYRKMLKDAEIEFDEKYLFDL